MNTVEDKRKCFKCGCSPAKDDVKLFRFPKPGVTNLIRCLMWSKYIFPDKEYASLTFQSKLHSEHRMLCHRHFKNSDFVNDSRTKLLRIAIPSDENISDESITINDVDVSQEGELLSIIDVPRTGEELNIPELNDTRHIPNIDDAAKAEDPLNILEEAPATEEDQSIEDCDLEDVNMRDIRACRACLDSQGTLMKINNTHRRIFESACGVVISPNDGYPYYFCTECMANIKKILSFRRKSRRADFVLKEIMTIRKEVSSMDVVSVDRKITNLVSSLEIWKPENIHFYSCFKTSEKGDNTLLNEPVKYDNGTIKIQYEPDIVDEIKDVKVFDDREEVTALGEDGFDSVHNIVTTLGTNDTVSNDVVEAMKLEVDLNDVFKGLEDKLDSDDEVKKLEEQKAELNKMETKKEILKRKREEKMLKKEKDRNIQNMTCRSIACKLANFQIVLLSTEEQISRHEMRWTSEPFKSSLFKCTICVRVFSNVQLLIEHYEDHNQIQGKFSCNVCKLRFDNEDDRTIHMSEKHRYRYTCNTCQRDIYNFKIAVQHKCIRSSATYKNMAIDNELYDAFHVVPLSQEDMRAALENSTGASRCSVCRLAFTQYSVYKAHMDKHVERAKSKIQCEICGIYQSGEITLSIHMRHWHQYSWQCKICNFESSQRYRAIEHLEDHKASSSGCSYCSKTSKTQAGLKFHMRRFHYKEMYNKICPLCGIGFSSDIFFYSHQLQKHKYMYLPHPPEEKNELSCDHCDVEFMSRRAYETHLVLYGHEEAKDIPYTCLPCKKIFDNEDSRNMHALRCKSNNAFPMPCCICGVEVTSGLDYYHHCRKTHPTSLVHHGGKLCEKCGRTFSSRKWSMHLCRKRKSYKCTICEMQFLTSRSYGLHMIYKHTNRPFHCALCPEKFKRRIIGKEHILKIHTPVMPYSCSVCYRQFAVLKYLNEHVSSFHGIKEDQTYKIKKEKRCIFIYPHMKLDVSSIDRDKLKEVKLQVRDYNDTVIETINNDDDYDKYLIFDVKPDKVQKTRKKREKNELGVKQKKRKVETVVIETGENLEIIEVGGKKYVTINNVVYQVENQ